MFILLEDFGYIFENYKFIFNIIQYKNRGLKIDLNIIQYKNWGLKIDLSS